MNPESIRQWANRFSSGLFQMRFEKVLEDAWSKHLRVMDLADSDPAKILDFAD